MLATKHLALTIDTYKPSVYNQKRCRNQLQLISRPVARVFEEGVLKLSARKRGKFFGMTTPTFL